MDRLFSLVSLRVAALAVCALTLLLAPGAQAAPIFNVSGSSVDTLPMTRLPVWVQVATDSARLYAANSGEILAGGQRPGRYTFLRILGGGTYRLHVSAYDESGAPNLSGWVDPDSVVPSAAGTDWRVSSSAATLWRSTDPGATAVRSLEPFTPMQQVDGPVQSRIEVQIYAPDFSTALDLAWIDAADTGPAFAPNAAVPPAAGTAPANRTLSSANARQAFLDSTASAARVASARTGVPASVTVAQAILESDWGRASLAQDANNYFGIKAIGRLGSDGVVWMPTGEFDDAGQLYQTISPFRAYKSLSDSIVDHDDLLTTAPRYAAAMRVSNDPKQFAQGLSAAGYSTDPQYADKLVVLMDSYNLYRLDG